MISECFQVKESEVFLAGSAKIGFSLSPPQKDSSKLFHAFRIEGEKPSDLDIAIISETLFNKFWYVYRNARYYSRNEVTYGHVYNETYRGFINSKNLQEFYEGRIKWNGIVKKLKKQIFEQFYIKNEIDFRIYRSEYDFRQYHIQGIEKIKRLI